MIRNLLAITWGIIVFLLLTLLTQVGGLIYVLALLVSIPLKKHLHSALLEFFLFPVVFVSFYLVAVAWVVPPLAKQFGREPLPWRGEVRPLTVWTCLLNRHYVVRPLKQVVFTAAKTIAEDHPGVRVNYLDANFPFLDKFPLWPHLSHNDGKKLDIAFFYTDKKGEPISNAPSPIGYGVYEGPRRGEVNYPERCLEDGFWQYGIIGELIPPYDTGEYHFNERVTAGFITALVDEKATEKIFIEPHLKTRMQLRSSKIRFQGCQAVRHDDHIHVQVK